MKVLLTHAYYLKDDPAENRVMKPYPPIGLLYLSAWLNQENISNQVYDNTFSSNEQFIEHFLTYRPDIIGIYATLMTKINVLRMISFIRENPQLADTKIIIGGPDARHYAQNYLDYGADIIIPGEGEVTLTEVVKYYSGQDIKKEEIKGIIYKTPNGDLINTEHRPALDIDLLPIPARENINMADYLEIWKTHHGYTSITINSMRGCPYSCNWCSKSIFGNTYRRRSPASVADELSFIKEQYHPDQVWFTDDVFTISREWLKKFDFELTQRKLLLPYECISRSDCLDEEIISLLKRTGCKKLWIGAESGSQRILNLMNRKTDIIRTEQMVKLLKTAGISTGNFIMLGYPGEKMKDIKLTVKYLKNSTPDEFTIAMAYPIKGTVFYSEVIHEINQPFNWQLQTEREIKFRSRYSDLFYRFAISYIHNSINVNKEKTPFKRIPLFIKALISRLMKSLLMPFKDLKTDSKKDNSNRNKDQGN